MGSAAAPGRGRRKGTAQARVEAVVKEGRFHGWEVKAGARTVAGFTADWRPEGYLLGRHGEVAERLGEDEWTRLGTLQRKAKEAARAWAEGGIARARTGRRNGPEAASLYVVRQALERPPGFEYQVHEVDADRTRTRVAHIVRHQAGEAEADTERRARTWAHAMMQGGLLRERAVRKGEARERSAEAAGCTSRGGRSPAPGTSRRTRPG